MELEDELKKAESTASLTANLTGGQIQQILDMLISEALQPIIECSKVFDTQVVYLMNSVTTNKKRKLTALGNEEFVTLLASYLVSKDKGEQINLIKEAKIERGFIYNFVLNFLQACSQYPKMYTQFLIKPSTVLDRKLEAIEHSVGASRKDLLPAVHRAQAYLDMFYKFRNSIVCQYLRHAYKHAKAYCSMKGAQFDFNCVYQNFIAAVIKAIDKYDCSKGALTSYIGFWLLNAQNNNSDHGHEYGLAYSIPQNHRKMLATAESSDYNFSVTLDDDSGVASNIAGAIDIEQEMLGKEEHYTMLLLIKRADPLGLARLYLDIDEAFTDKELDKMKRLTMEAV